MLDYLDVSTVRLGDTGTRSVTHVEGLIGLPMVRGVPYDVPEQDGQVEPNDQFLGARSVTVDFEVWAATIPLAFQDFGVILAALEAMSKTPALIKYRPAGDTRDLQMTGKFIGQCLPVLDKDDQGSFLRGAAQFRCADPRGYSQTLQSASSGAPSANGGMPTPLITPIPVGVGITGGSVTVVNAGNTKSWPTIYVTGPISGPVISIGADSLFLAGLTLADGQTLTIVTNTAGPRSLTVAGARVDGALTFASSVFAPLPAGSSTTVSFYSIGGGTSTDTNLTVAWRDAWTA